MTDSEPEPTIKPETLAVSQKIEDWLPFQGKERGLVAVPRWNFYMY